MKLVNYIALIIGIVGAVNWGLIGLFEFNLVSFLFGANSILSRLIYVLVGISGVYMLSFFPKLSDEKY